jgi:uncharacterized protein (TIGR02145 family)
LGNQIWFAENLRTTRYANGIEIPLILGNNAFKVYTKGARCYYENDEQLIPVFGMMYNWYAAVDSCRLCPEGWHVPSDEEWEILIDFLGGAEIAGGKMKSTDTSLWKSPNVGATNESGFSVLPGGYRDHNGIYNGRGSWGIFWSTTVYNYLSARVRITEARHEKAYSDFSTNEHAFYVRCVKDE